MDRLTHREMSAAHGRARLWHGGETGWSPSETGRTTGHGQLTGWSPPDPPGASLGLPYGSSMAAPHNYAKRNIDNASNLLKSQRLACSESFAMLSAQQVQ